MKKFLIINILLFTSFFSNSSYSDWVKVVEDLNGNIFYVDFERIRKNDKYVYYWFLVDLIKPSSGYLSSKTYNEGDCKMLRFRDLQFVNHYEQMGKDPGDVQTNENPKWQYANPNTVNEFILQTVCLK